MERILRGIMRYRNTTREQMVKEFQKVRDHPEVSGCTFESSHKALAVTEFVNLSLSELFFN